MSIKKLLTTMTLAGLVLSNVPVYAEEVAPTPVVEPAPVADPAPMADPAPAPAPEADPAPAPAPATDGENKPAESKPEGEKPADEKPVDNKPAESKPEGEKPADEKPADNKPADEKPIEKPMHKDGYTIKYVADPTAPRGMEELVTAGKPAELNADGSVKTPMVEAVIKVGTKPTVKRHLPENFEESFKAKVKYIADDKAEAGSKRQVEQGYPAHKVDIIEYKLDETTGKTEEVARRSEEVKETHTIVAIGTKPKVETKKGFAVKYIDDKNLPEGKEVVVDKGEEGELEITTTYTVNEETGELTEKKEEKMKSGKVKVVRRGVKKDKDDKKPTVEKEKGGNKSNGNGGQATAPAPAQTQGASTGKGLPQTGDVSLAVWGALSTALGSAVAFVRGGKKD